MKRPKFRIFAVISMLLWIAVACLCVVARYGGGPVTATIWPGVNRIDFLALRESIQLVQTQTGTRTTLPVMVGRAALPLPWANLTTMPSIQGNVNFSMPTKPWLGIRVDSGANSAGTINGSLNTAQFIPWRSISMPYPLVMLPFSIAPIAYLYAAVRRRRPLPANICRYCGYDIRATPPHGRCPECGNPRDAGALTLPVA